MNISIPDLSSGDDIINGFNARLALIEAILSSIPGANLQTGTVANGSLAKGKSVFTQSIYLEADKFNTSPGSVAGWWAYKLPNLDGASNTSFKYLGKSVSVRTLATAPGAGSLLTTNKNGGAIHQMDITVVVAAKTGYVSLAASAVSAASGDQITEDYTYATAGDCTGIQISHFWSVQHVGT